MAHAYLPGGDVKASARHGVVGEDGVVRLAVHAVNPAEESAVPNLPTQTECEFAIVVYTRTPTNRVQKRARASMWLHVDAQYWCDRPTAAAATYCDR